jgi:hypothetical protein
MHSTNRPGDSCNFRFVGTGVWYFTDYFGGNANVTISVDNAPSELVNTASVGNAGVCPILHLESEHSLTVFSADPTNRMEQDRLERRTAHRYYHPCGS